MKKTRCHAGFGTLLDSLSFNLEAEVGIEPAYAALQAAA